MELRSSSNLGWLDPQNEKLYKKNINLVPIPTLGGGPSTDTHFRVVRRHGPSSPSKTKLPTQIFGKIGTKNGGTNFVIEYAAGFCIQGMECFVIRECLVDFVSEAHKVNQSRRIQNGHNGHCLTQELYVMPSTRRQSAAQRRCKNTAA